MNSVLWYIHRLSKMSPCEMLYRVQHKLRERHDAHAFAGRPLTSPLVPSGLQLSLNPIFILSQHIEPDQLAHWCDSTDVHFYKKADLWLENKVDVFGSHKNFGHRID